MSTIRGRKLEKIRDLGFFLQKLAFMSRMRSNESEALKQQKFISFFVSSSALNKKKKNEVRIISNSCNFFTDLCFSIELNRFYSKR